MQTMFKKTVSVILAFILCLCLLPQASCRASAASDEYTLFLGHDTRNGQSVTCPYCHAATTDERTDRIGRTYVHYIFPGKHRFYLSQGLCKVTSKDTVKYTVRSYDPNVKIKILKQTRSYVDLKITGTTENKLNSLKKNTIKIHVKVTKANGKVYTANNYYASVDAFYTVKPARYYVINKGQTKTIKSLCYVHDPDHPDGIDHVNPAASADSWVITLASAPNGLTVSGSANLKSARFTGIKQGLYTYEVTAAAGPGSSNHIIVPSGRSVSTGKKKTVTAGKTIVYSFVPEETGKYKLTLSNAGGEMVRAGGSHGTRLKLTAGKTYYVWVTAYDSNACFKISRYE